MLGLDINLIFTTKKFNICTMLEAGVRPTLDFDVNLIFNFQPKFFIYPTLVETSSQLWDLMSTFLFPTKFNVCPMLEVDVKRTLGFDVNPILISNQNSMCSMLEVNVKPKLEVDINPTLSFDCNLILISNQIVVFVQCWRRTSSHYWILYVNSML